MHELQCRGQWVKADDFWLKLLQIKSGSNELRSMTWGIEVIQLGVGCAA